jgi:hypothetical protein
MLTFFSLSLGPCLLNGLGGLSSFRPSAFASVGLHVHVIDTEKPASSRS